MGVVCLFVCVCVCACVCVREKERKRAGIQLGDSSGFVFPSINLYQSINQSINQFISLYLFLTLSACVCTRTHVCAHLYLSRYALLVPAKVIQNRA